MTATSLERALTTFHVAAVRDVLYTGCLLEYHNHDPWFGVHPLVRPLLEA